MWEKVRENVGVRESVGEGKGRYGRSVREVWGSLGGGRGYVGR